MDPGRQTIVRSGDRHDAGGSEAPPRIGSLCHLHTLYTRALGPKGEVLAELPEQVPHLEWQHSAFRQEQSCQS